MNHHSLTIDQANEDEIPQIVDFLLRNKSKTLPPPSEDELLQAAKDGSLFFAFRGNDRHDIVATGGSFVWLRGMNDPQSSYENDIVVYELAAMRVVDVGGVGPFALQDLFIWIRTVSLALWEQPISGQVSLMTAVLGNAEKSLGAMQRNGFRELQERPKWLQYQHSIWTREDEEAHYFWVPPETLRDHARKLAELLTSTITLERRHKSTSEFETFSVTIAVPLLTSLIPAMIDIGKGGGTALVLRPPPKYKRLGNGFI